MTTEDLSAALTEMLQKLTEGKGVDVRHDHFLSRKNVMDLFEIKSANTLLTYIKQGKFPQPINVLGKECWPSSVINAHIRKTNPQLREQDEVRAEAIAAARSA